MQRFNKTTKIVSVAILSVCLAAGMAFAGSNYNSGGQYGYHNNGQQAYDNVLGITTASGSKTGVVCDLSAPYFQETYADQLADSDYGQASGNSVSVLNTVTSSGSTAKTSGVICDLSDPYFKANYPDQM